MFNFFTLIIVLALISVAKSAPPKLFEGLNETSTDPNDVGFYLFPNPKNFSDFDVLDYQNVATIKKSRFSGDKKLIILTHGFTQSLNSDFPQVLIRDYLNAGYAKTTNIIAVDWGKLSGSVALLDPIVLLLALEELPLYRQVAKNVPVVGKRLQQFIVLLQNNYQNLVAGKIHLVGQSLGAHVSGYAGMYYFEVTKNKLDRITGTEPAGPLFQRNPPNQRLDASDADFVDIVHTNQGNYGFVGPLGDVDFFVNGGVFQPACYQQSENSPFCSHDTAPHYYGMSIVDKSLKASKDVILPVNTVTFGEFCERSAKGSYYINIQLPASKTP